MEHLLIGTAFPTLHNDMTIAKAQIEASAQLPSGEGLPADVVLDMTMTYVLFLINDKRTAQASQVVDYLIYADDVDQIPTLYLSWLWLARMTIFVHDEHYPLALGCAENALQHLANFTAKRQEDFLAQVAAILYNLAYVHHNTGDNSRAAKELTHAQKLLERLAKKNESRFSAMLLLAVQASTAIIQSRSKQMSVFEHYQKAAELYTTQLETDTDTHQAMNMLIDTLKKEGDIMLDMGNGRNAVKYYTKALRYQKKLNEALGVRELQLSIGLAKGLLRLNNRRQAAEQLLNSLLPLARTLKASREVIEIENLLAGKNRNFNIMTLLKGIF